MWNRSNLVPARFPRPGLAPLIVALVAAAWIFWLRWPSLDHQFWNPDEGIYATVGRTVLDGGVMYRDVVDHRSPLTHYLTAGIFAVAGVNNITAMHAALAGLVTLTALGLFLLGRAWRGTATGLWAAAVFAALSTDLFFVVDAYAFGTEWVLILFSTWSAWWFWVHWPRAGFWPAFAAGAGYAAAFLAKQPGLLEAGPAALLLVYLAATRRLPVVPAVRVLAGLVSGFTAAVALTFAYFWRHGVLGDFYFYGWTYNLVYYGADTSAADRLDAARELPRLLGAEYPLLLGVVIVAALAAVHLLTRDQPAAADRPHQPSAFFLLCWLALSTAGSASAGRVHPHYYIQALPALALAAAWLLGAATNRCLAPGRAWLRLGAGALVLAAAWNVIAHPIRGRARPDWGVDTIRDPAAFIKAHSRPGDRVIVWGAYPDFYAYADRAPASRFIYTTLQTGAQPGRNVGAGVNTDAYIVPGTMDTLLRELDAARPVFLVDTSMGPQRYFDKYPVSRFPRLARFVSENYLEVEATRFRPHGFRVLMLKDAGRRTPLPLAPGPTPSALEIPRVFGPPNVSQLPAEFEVQAVDQQGQLQRIELLVNDAVVDRLTFPPMDRLTVRFTVPMDRLGGTTFKLEARATSADGETRTGPPLLVAYLPDALSPDQRAALALPRVVTGPKPVLATATYGVGVIREDDSVAYFAHAPSTIRYVLVPDGARLEGRFGFKPGAYAESNPGRTDGAEFIITWTSAGGQRKELLRRTLRPVETPADRGEQPFNVQLPADKAEGALELVITPGPNGNAASDWTYWSGLALSERH